MALRFRKSTAHPPVPTRRAVRPWSPLRRIVVLAAALIVLNLACHLLLPAQFDLTQRRAFSPAPQTANLLASLQSPLEVVLLAPRVARTPAEQNFQKVAGLFRELVETCRASQPLLRWQELDPTDSPEAAAWQARFPDLVPPCVLIVPSSGSAAPHEVLTARELGQFHPADATRPARFDFLGEQAFTAALARLTGDRQTAVVYFATGHGELGTVDDVPESRRSAGQFLRLLGQVDCRAAPLDLSEVERVPHDAALVVVAGGERPWTRAEAERLETYLRQGGRALVLCDWHYDARHRQPAVSGLEALCARFGVSIGPNRVVMRNFAGQLERSAAGLPAGGEHPLVRALPQSPVTLVDCRSLQISTDTRRWPARITPLLVSHPAPRAWAEGDSGVASATEPGGPQDLNGPVAMAMAVERPGDQGAEPVLVVVGETAFVSNQGLSGPAGRVHASFALSCLNWLRGRRELLGDIPPRTQETIQLTGNPENHRGLVWKSSLLLCAVIATTGVTVWTSRRIG